MKSFQFGIQKISPNRIPKTNILIVIGNKDMQGSCMHCVSFAFTTPPNSPGIDLLDKANNRVCPVPNAWDSGIGRRTAAEAQPLGWTFFNRHTHCNCKTSNRVLFSLTHVDGWSTQPFINAPWSFALCCCLGTQEKICCAFCVLLLVCSYVFALLSGCESTIGWITSDLLSHNFLNLD